MDNRAVAVRDTSPPVSLTRDMRSYLMGKAPQLAPVIRQYPESCTESVYKLAFEEGRTLEQWVHDDPQHAVRMAQLVVATWEGILSSASITGTVQSEAGTHRITREQAKMIERTVTNARADLDLVSVIANNGSPESLRKDRLITTLYNKALNGDIKAIAYFMDRVEGRIPEAKGTEINYDSRGDVFNILHSLFEAQLKVLNTGVGTVICKTGRRAGKTQLSAALMLIECLRKPGTVCIYVCPTMKQGEKLINAAMNTIIDTVDLRDANGNRFNWRKIGNDSEIVIRGLSNTQDPDVIRGLKAKVIIIDEVFHLKSELLEYLHREVLEPMQLDYADDYKQLLIGTPPKIRGTYAQDMWETMEVPKFHWTANDNPHVQDLDEYVAKIAHERGIDVNHSFIRREYYGEDCYDEDLFLYPDYHTWSEDMVPQLSIDRILCGLDYGVSDNDAIIAIAWDSKARRGFVFYESKFNRLTTPKGVTQFEQMKYEIRELWEYALDFWPGLEPKEANKRITWEADCSDQHLTEELRCNLLCRHEGIRLNIGNCHRSDRILMEDKIRALLRKADLLLPEGGKTARECMMTVLKADVKGNPTQEIDDKVFHPDLLPALRYALWPAIGQEVLEERGGVM